MCTGSASCDITPTSPMSAQLKEKAKPKHVLKIPKLSLIDEDTRNVFSIQLEILSHRAY